MKGLSKYLLGFLVVCACCSFAVQANGPWDETVDGDGGDSKSVYVC